MLPVGTRIMVNAVTMRVNYIYARQAYTNMYIGKVGTIIGYSTTGKYAVEFDDVTFIGDLENRGFTRSSHDNGCHGRGKDHYCWYIPPYAFDVVPEYSRLLLLC